MGAGDIYAKTSRGLQEVSSRKLKLPPRLRTMLILVDGHQPTLILSDEAAKIGAPEDFLDQLLRLQLIEKSGTATSHVSKDTDRPTSPLAAVGDEYTRFRVAKDFMNVTVVDAMGIKSFFFTLKLERAGNIADLRELVDAYHAAIAKASGVEEARVFTERLNILLR